MRVARDIIRLLTFRISRDEMLQFTNKHLIWGLVGTWIVGMGRYWDDPGAHILQHLGMGSVIYVFVLSAFIWLIIKPFFVDRWNYRTVLTFLSLTSFPAALYAIPVERFVDIRMASEMNAKFLAVVAVWRLALLFVFLSKYTKLHFGYVLVGALMPVCLIVNVLTVLNLERVVYNFMSGVRHATGADGSYLVVSTLSMLSMLLIIPLVIAYISGIFVRWNLHKSVRKRIKAN